MNEKNNAVNQAGRHTSAPSPAAGFEVLLITGMSGAGRQLKRIIRYQALALSLAGIPVGLLLGWLVGAGLTPAVIGRLNGVTNVVSVNPVLFAASALFAL